MSIRFPFFSPSRSVRGPAHLAAACILAALSAWPAPAAAASCAEVVAAAADEAQRLQGLTGLTLHALSVGCGDGGPAAVVQALTQRGDCGDAAQLGRSLPGNAGMDGAIAGADRCLRAQVVAGLDDLDSEVESARAPSVDTPYATNESTQQGAGGLGTRGAGNGGGGRFGDYGKSSRDGYASSGPPPASRPAADGPRKSASTGMGAYAPSPQAKTTQRIAAGTTVAWSRVGLSVWFDFDSASLRPEAFATLAALADQLAGLDGATVMEVVGHTDSLGSIDYNDDLSQWRAGSVMYALRSLGVSPDRLDLRGAGELEPVQSNASEWGRAMNRRVEFQFYRPVAMQITR